MAGLMADSNMKMQIIKSELQKAVNRLLKHGLLQGNMPPFATPFTAFHNTLKNMFAYGLYSAMSQ